MVAIDFFLWICCHSNGVLKGARQQSVQGHIHPRSWSAAIPCCWGNSHPLALATTLSVGKVHVLFLEAVKVDFIQLEGHLHNCLPCRSSTAIDVHGRQETPSLPLRRYRAVNVGSWDLHTLKQLQNHKRQCVIKGQTVWYGSAYAKQRRNMIKHSKKSFNRRMGLELVQGYQRKEVIFRVWNKSLRKGWEAKVIFSE